MVPKRLSSIYQKLSKDLPDEENRKESEAFERAKPISDFYREFGTGLTGQLPAELASQWRGPDCLLEIRLVAEKFTARGTYELAQGGLLAAMMSSGGFTKRPDAAPLRFQVDYAATARGRVLIGKVERIREGGVLKKAAATLLTQEEGSTVLMVVSVDGKAIRVLERRKNGSPRIYAFSAT